MHNFEFMTTETRRTQRNTEKRTEGDKKRIPPTDEHRLTQMQSRAKNSQRIHSASAFEFICDLVHLWPILHYLRVPLSLRVSVVRILHFEPIKTK